MRIRLFNHPPTTSNLHFTSRYTSLPKSDDQIKEIDSYWFVKVVCTLHVRRNAAMKEPHVLDYFQKNLNPPTAFRVIKHLHSNLNRPRLAFGFLEYSKNMLNLVHGIETYGFVLRAFCRVGVLDLAELVLGLMRVDGLVPDGSVLGFVVTSFVNAGRFEVAKELIVERVRNGGDDGVVSFFVVNKLLSSLVKNNRVDEAVGLLENVVLGSQCCSFDAYTFNIIISGLCKAKEVEKAFGFLHKMSKFGCEPDSVTYNTLLNGFCRVGDVDKAHELLKDVRSPDVVTFTSVISGYCKLGKMEDALVLFDNMMNHGIRPNTFTFNIMIDGFGKIGNVVSVKNMYEKMLNLGCTPDVITFTSIIDGHCRVGDVRQGLEIWDEMNRRNLYPNIYTFNILIHSLCKESKLHEARELLRQLGKRGDIVPKAFVYNPVIDGFCKAGNVDEANLIVREMEERRCKLDKITFTILIIGHCMKGRMVEAITLFEKMQIIGCAPDLVTVNSLVSCLLKAGMPKEAFEIRKAASGARVPQTDVSYSKDVDIPVAV